MRLTTSDPLAYTLLGAPIWPLRGAADDDGGTGGDDGGDGDGDDGNPDDGLTDAGRQAIERERKAARTARERAKPWVTLSRELGLTPEQIRERLTNPPKTDDDSKPVDVEAVKREAAAEAEARANARILKSEVRRLAGETFIDPSDALPHLDLDSYEVDEDGAVDEEAIKKDLKAVLKAKPHLGKRSTPKDFDEGARKTSDAPKSMSDLIRETAASRRGGGTR